MLDPACAISVDDLECDLTEQTGQIMSVEAGVRPYVNLLVSNGVITTSSCEGHDGDLPWILYDSSSATEEEVSAILTAAKLDEGVEITDGHTYETEEFTLVEKRITFPRRHPAAGRS